jgi:hypothetical protein
MDLLKKNNWLLCLFLNIISLGMFNLFLAHFLDCYNEDAWYKKWPYWVFGTLCLFFPVYIMLIVLVIQMECTIAKKLDIAGSEIYASPYSWILCIIIPIVGWVLLIVMSIYIFIFIHIRLKQGYAEKFIK